MENEAGGSVDTEGMSLGQAAMAMVDEGGVPETPSEGAEEVGALSPEPEDSDAGGEFGLGELEGFLDGFDKEPDTDEIQFPDEDGGEEASDGAPEGRAQRRIRALNEQLKAHRGETEALQARLGEYNQWAQQQYSQHQQLTQAYQDQRVEMAKLQAMVESMSRGEPRQKDAVEEFRESVQGAALAKAQEHYDPVVRQLEERLNSYERREKERADQIARTRRLRQHNQEADAAAASELFSHADAEALPAESRNLLASLILATSSFTGEDIPTAAKTLRKSTFDLFKGILKAQASRKGAKVRESQQTPGPSARGRSGAKGAILPSSAELQKQGYGDNYLKYMIDKDLG